jgi:hypothetical protein
MPNRCPKPVVVEFLGNSKAVRTNARSRERSHHAATNAVSVIVRASEKLCYCYASSSLTGPTLSANRSIGSPIT